VGLSLIINDAAHHLALMQDLASQLERASEVKLKANL